MFPDVDKILAKVFAENRKNTKAVMTAQIYAARYIAFPEIKETINAQTVRAMHIADFIISQLDKDSKA